MCTNGSEELTEAVEDSNQHSDGGFLQKAHLRHMDCSPCPKHCTVSV